MNKPTKLPTVEQAIEEVEGATATLHGAMSLAFAEIEAATKSANNPHFRSKYADLTSIIEAVKPPLIKYGLFFTQRCQPDQEGVCVETVLHHRSGEKESLGSLYVPANKRDAQGFGSALTYARRYALQTAFGVPTEDDDGNAAVRTQANPSTGEPRRRESVALDGPYDTLPKLERAAKEFTRTLRSIGSLEELNDLRKDEEVKAFVKQCKRDLPGWWSKGPTTPADYKPLEDEIAELERGLITLEQQVEQEFAAARLGEERNNR